MSDKLDNKKLFKEFGLTTLSLKNRNTVFLLAIVLVLFGVISYRALPKELFPEINTPYIMVQTTYPGNSPVDIENLVTNPIEKELESITGIKVMTSTSAQDASMIFIEFNFDVDIDQALQDVRDGVDKAMPELPNDLPVDPLVMDIDFSEFPFININLSGDYSIDELKRYAELLEDEIEKVPQVSKVVIQGINEKEIKVHVDKDKLDANELTFNDIENAIKFENMNVSGGEILIEGTRRSVRTVGEFESIDDLRNIIVKHEDQKIVYLKDIADVIDGYEEPSSIARLDGHPVVSLQVIKKGGENLLAATAGIEKILGQVNEDHLLPSDLNIAITNDQSDMVKKQLNNLENSMIMSILFVVVVLFFFLGTRNALLVGLAIPMSMFLSFLVLRVIDFKVNMIVLFSLILALGMLVDNAIVVVENIYRYISKGVARFEAAKKATGEIAVPIIASTMTTLAAFIPLAFWDSIVGEFMKYLPITLIVVLTSSLFVALVIIPIVSFSFVKKDAHLEKPNQRRALLITAILAITGILSYLARINWLGTIFIIGALVALFNLYVFNNLGRWFQVSFLVWLERQYTKVLRYALAGRKPFLFLGGTTVLLILTIFFFSSTNPKVLFFPNNNPSFLNILVDLPVGNDITITDEFMYGFEEDVNTVLGDRKKIVKSMLTNIGTGAIGQSEIGSLGGRPTRGLVTISFLDYEDRHGINTSEIMADLTLNLKSKYPGVVVTTEKNSMGPPTGKPVNIEVSGRDYEAIIALTDSMERMIETAGIPGIENLQIDLNLGKPEMIVHIDRERARRFGMSTAQIATTIRTALFGKDISDFKVGDEEYPIQLRLKDDYRYNTASLMNQKVQFRDNRGNLTKVPISAVASFTFSSTYGSVKHKDAKRVVTLWSNVIEGYNATTVNSQIKQVLKSLEMPNGYEYRFTGEQQDQQESMSFLIQAMFIAVSIMLIILVTQFNSLFRPIIILASVAFSTIGVFGGLATFRMDFVVVMTGIGIVSLAGVVVNNAIVLIDYIEQLKNRKRDALGLAEDELLSVEDATECVVEAGRTRLRPVLLTAITTILGLIPMATGMNVDFEGFLNNFNPNIYFGGDMVAMWGPISWTVIFGLSFATFLTLVIVPVMYRITVKVQAYFRKES